MPLFDDLLFKVANQEKLSESELSAFRLEAQKLNVIKEAVGFWLPPGGNMPKIQSPTLGQPTWIESPLHVLQVVKTGLTNVADNTSTPVTWDATLTNNKGKLFRVDSADASRIYVMYTGVNFAIVGTHQWESNTTGYRQVKATFYDKDGNSLGSQVYSTISPVQTDVTYGTVADVVIAPDFVDLAYFKISVAQTSGGVLDLNSIRLSFFQV
jgi:hypothetical protein